MTDKKSSESRRKLLKSIAAGSGAIVAGKSLPESWSRPVVDSVMLPAHAQTSTAPPAPPRAPDGIYSITNASSPPAGTSADDKYRVCVTVNGSTADVTFQPIYTSGAGPGGPDLTDANLTGIIPSTIGASGTLTPSPNSCVDISSFVATITAASPTSLTLDVVGNRTITVVLPAVSACVDFIAEIDVCD
ncbi:hypothetical protein ACFL2N_02145 [Pseudomonadota bacterium]